MSEYAWFKLLVRAVGVLLLGLGGPMIVWYVARLLLMGLPGSPGATSRSFVPELTMAVPGILAYGSQTALGCYLIFRGDWIINRVLREVQGRCAICGYDLHGLASHNCPECNAPVRASSVNQTPTTHAAAIAHKEESVP